MTLVPANSHGSVLQVVTVQVSSAEILALNPTPKTLIPAPGAGKYLWVEHVFCSFHAGASVYTAVSNPEVLSWLGSGAEAIAPWIVPCFKSAVDVALPWNATAGNEQGQLDQLASASGNNPAVAEGLIVNKAVVLTVDSGSAGFAAGDGTATFTIEYRVISV